MDFSAMPFWKWALTPQKVSHCPFAPQLFFEGIVCKLSVVALVVEFTDAVLLGKVFQGSLSLHCLFRVELGHQVDVLQS